MEITCVFEENSLSGDYTCHLKSITTQSDQVTVTGDHVADKTDKDVERFATVRKDLQQLPMQLIEKFTNLTNLSTYSCGLREISRLDLLGLDKLEYLNLSFNKLTSLPDDLLVNKPKLRSIDFRSNKITTASSKLLLPLINNDLDVADFRKNVTVDDFFKKDKNHTLNYLMAQLDNKCKPPTKMFSEPTLKDCERLLETGEFSNFVIKVDDGEGFKVHKNVLSSSSPVFKAMFSEHTQENQNGELIITDFESSAVGDFLHFLCNGVVRDAENGMELLVLAVKYDVPALKEISEEIVYDNIDESNALEVFNLGHLHSSDKLKRFSLVHIGNFLKAHLDDRFMDQTQRLQTLVETRRKILKLEENLKNLLEI